MKQEIAGVTDLLLHGTVGSITVPGDVLEVIPPTSRTLRLRAREGKPVWIRCS